MRALPHRVRWLLGHLRSVPVDQRLEQQTQAVPAVRLTPGLELPDCNYCHTIQRLPSTHSIEMSPVAPLDNCQPHLESEPRSLVAMQCMGHTHEPLGG